MTPGELRHWRLCRGWTQERAAEWAGVDPRTWRRWELGEYAIHPVLAKLMTTETGTPAQPTGR